MAKLVLSLNGNILNQYFIDKPVISIGRGSDNDIVIADALLSREHARIVSVGEDHIIEDLQSSNGTLVNGTLATRKILHHRDVIRLGKHSLSYQNSRMASDIDLERTMLIRALPREAQVDHKPLGTLPAMRSSTVWLSSGRVTVMAAPPGQHAVGTAIRLDRVVTTFGSPGKKLFVIGRRPQGYFLAHVEGMQLPRINGKSITSEPQVLHDGDEIEGAGYRLSFNIENASVNT